MREKKGYKMTVLLEDGTVGTVESAEIGKVSTVSLLDENDNDIEDTGVVVEILED